MSSTMSPCFDSRDGNGEEGWGQRMGSSPPPSMVLSCLILAPPCMMKETSLHHPCPLGLAGPTPPCKILLYVNFPHNYYIFFNKTCFININIFRITTKFITPNKTNF